jgi:hypothetical protein
VFEQRGGVNGQFGQLQSRFEAENTGERIQVKVQIPLGQSQFEVALFRGDTEVIRTFADSDEFGNLAVPVENSIADLGEYDIVVIDPRTISLEGTFPEPTELFIGGQVFIADRATITNFGGSSQLTSFESIDIMAANTDISIRQVVTDPPHGFVWAEGGRPPAAGDHALIFDGNVKIASNETVNAQSATVHGGRLDINGVLTTNALFVHEGSLTSGVGMLDGSLYSSAPHAIAAIDDFVVTREASFDGGRIIVEDPYPPIYQRGTITDPYVGLRAGGGITATGFNRPGDHLGRGVFLQNIALNDLRTEITVQTMSAKQGDLDGNRTVSVLEAFSVVGNLRRTGVDFTNGDDDGDGTVEVLEAFTAVGNLGTYVPQPFVAQGGIRPLEATSTGSLTDAAPTLLYDVNTGRLTIEDGGAANPSLRGLFLSTTKLNGVVFQNALDLTAINGDKIVISNDLTVDDTSLAFSTLPMITNIFGEGDDFGLVLPPGLTQAQLNSELTVIFQREVGGMGVQFVGDILVPEPSTIGSIVVALMAVAALSRRGKRFTCQF